MPPAIFRSAVKPPSGRYLSLAEREDIALLLVQGHSLQEIGRRLDRSASTISREVRRNATTRGGVLDYRATVAQWHAERSARRPKATKLAGNAALRSYVEERLASVARTGGSMSCQWRMSMTMIRLWRKGGRHGPTSKALELKTGSIALALPCMLLLSAESCAQTATDVRRTAIKRVGQVAAGLIPGNSACSILDSSVSTNPALAKQLAADQRLPPLNLSDMRLWNYNGAWMASEWASQGPMPYRYDHVGRAKNHAATLTLDNAGAPQLKAYSGNPSRTSGIWQADVTLPQTRDGLVTAPLWLYNEKSREEVDIEFTGRTGLQVTVHTYPGGVHTTDQCNPFPDVNFSGQRHLFTIYLDEAAGEVEVFMDRKSIARFGKASKAFPSTDLKPIIEMWAANPANPGFVSWVGRWQPLADREKLTMIVWGVPVHAAISLYIQARGVLKKELPEQLRAKRTIRRSRHASLKRDGSGQIRNAGPISKRPPCVEDRAVPGHWEGDLISGARASHVVTLLERQSRYVILAKVANKQPATVVSALIGQARKLPGDLCGR